MTHRTLTRLALAAAGVLALAGTARAEMVLSQVIVDLTPDKPARGDIEVFNDGPERMYVAADPFEIKNPGTPQEQRVPAPDPEQSGLLVAPQKLVLEPGERRIVRVAALGDRPAADRVYRLAIKPVAGAVKADESALKVFVGYDALVLIRPAQFTGDIANERSGRTLTLTNAGNTAQEVFGGRQCDASGKACRDLPAKRLYAGASWSQPLPYDTPVTYKAGIAGKVRERTL
jgi:P pilus assembly chaperone PapD